jgi:hypothetical protein
MNETKAWWQSKTIWLNLIALLAAVLTVVVDDQWVQQNPRLVLAVGGALTVLNMVLRMLTGQPISAPEARSAKAPLLIVALLAVSASAKAQSLGGSAYLTARADPILVATSRLASIEDVYRGYDLDISTFAGYNLQSRSAVYGFALLAPFSIGKNATAAIGPAVRWEDSRAASYGIVLGFRL